MIKGEYEWQLWHRGYDRDDRIVEHAVARYGSKREAEEGRKLASERPGSFGHYFVMCVYNKQEVKA